MPGKATAGQSPRVRSKEGLGATPSYTTWHPGRVPRRFDRVEPQRAYAGSYYRMEIYRRDGTLVGVGEDSPQLGTLELLGAQRGNTLARLPLPSRFNIAPPATPAGEAVNIGQLYAAFAGPIRGGSSNHPTFETAMAMHRVTDAMRQRSDMTRAFHSGKINPSTDMAASAVSQAVPKV